MLGFSSSFPVPPLLALVLDVPDCARAIIVDTPTVFCGAAVISSRPF